LREFEIDGEKLYCSMSFGAARFPEHGRSFSELMKKAGMALSAAKAEGKNSFLLFSEPAAEAKLHSRLELEGLLRNTIKQDFQRFALCYQPITDMKTGKIAGAEALVRLFDDSGNVINPQNFIPLCEHNGLILPLGLWVLQTGINFCKSVNDAGYPDFKLHINLSLKQILGNDLCESIGSFLEKSEIKTENIVFEVTETAAYSDFDKVGQVLMRLKNTGVRLAIDDFGTGFTSMKALKNLPFDLIKIDVSYITDIFNPDGDSAAFIRMITELGHIAGRKVCAEGVETQQQADYLKENNVDEAQGYLFGRPAHGDALIKMLGEN